MSTRKGVPVVLPRGSTRAWRILAGNTRSMTRRQLNEAAYKSVFEAVVAGCMWERHAEPPLGDYRSAVFCARRRRDSGLCVQLWSFPHHPVLIDIAGDAGDPPPGRWVRTDVAERMKGLGFKAGGEPHGYERELRVESMRDARRMARLVLDVFFEAYGYRGLVPIEVQTVYSGRASEDYVYTSFSAEEIAWIAARLGYAARVVFEDAEEATARIAIRRGRTVAEIVLGDPVERQQYGSGFLGSPAVSPSVGRRVRKVLRRDPPDVKPDAWRVGVTLYFDGGVTAEWVAQRIEYGMALIAGRRPRPGPLLSLSTTSRPPRRLPHMYSVEEVAEELSASVSEVEDAIRRHLKAVRCA